MPEKPTYGELEQRILELEQAESDRKIIDITDRKQAEDNLSQIFDMSLDMICIADINTATFVKVNPAFTHTLGYSEQELLGKPFSDFIHPEDIDRTLAVIDQKLQKNAKIINFENRYRCKDKSYRWLSWVSHPNTERGITFSVARDITEWKKNKERLDDASRLAKVGGWELDVQTLEVNWTEETYRIHEIPLDQNIPLQKAINFYHPEDRPRLERAIKCALDHQEPYDMEIRLITARGRQLWTRTLCQPEVLDGKTVKLKGTFQDITKQKITEEALQKSEKKYRKIFYEAQVALFRTRISDGKLIDANERYALLAGYSTIEDCKVNFHPGKAWVDPESRKNLKRLLAKNGSVKDYETKILRADGIPIWISLSATTYPENGYMEGSIEDISKAKDAYEQLKDLNTALDVLLKKREKDNQGIEENILSNFELMIKPFLSKLKKEASNQTQKNLMGILENNLNEIVTPFTKKLTNPMMRLTQTEIQIASLIKQGFTNKQIAQTLYCSKRTIDTHRENIRKKLDIKNKKINLKTALLNL